MLVPARKYLGIDPTATQKPFTVAILDADCRLLGLETEEMEGMRLLLASQPEVLAAVNAPPRPNQGLVRKQLEKQSLTGSPLRGADLRQAEYELHQRGIAISPTVGRAESCSGWIQAGFSLYRSMIDLGFLPFPAEGTTRQWLETHPHAAFCSLLGKVPLPKPTLEGRLQRQLALYEAGVGIQDPMEFFEEITRYRLLHGILPTETIYLPGELDAISAAYIAWLAGNKPEDVLRVGDPLEGQITLPVRELIAQYS
jgi:hypothetical protein